MTSVTIAICNYNYERFLSTAIDSALAQDFPDTRVLVVDDGSSDGSREIIAGYGSRIQSVFKENGGQTSAYNRAIAEVGTDVVILLDADDVLYPGAVSAVVDIFESGEYGKVQFKLDVMTSNGELTGTQIPHSDAPKDCGALLQDGWLYPSPPASGNAYRTAALWHVFPIPETADTRYGADFFAIYGSALIGPVASIGRALGAYRVHQSSASGVSFANSEDAERTARALRSRWAIFRKIVRARLGIELPARFNDFSYEKALFCSEMHGATLMSRYAWFARRSGSYLRSIVDNPFWGIKKKLGLLALSSLCLVPHSGVSDYAVRYIANPLSRRSGSMRESQ